MKAEGSPKELNFSLDYSRKITFNLSPQLQTPQEIVDAESDELYASNGLSIGRLAKARLSRGVGKIRELPTPNELVTAAATLAATICAVVMAVRGYHRAENVGNTEQ